MQDTTKATSCKHPYNAQYRPGDAFNSHENKMQTLTPVTPEERAAANDRREKLVVSTRAKLSEGN
jgi:hypothetical protein